MNFFGRMNGDFSVSPSEYHRAHRNRVGAGRAFVGPWNYAGASPGSNVRKQYSSPQEQPKIATTPKRDYVSPQEHLKAVARTTTKKTGYVSPVEDLKAVMRKTYRYGTNTHLEAIAEE